MADVPEDMQMAKDIAGLIRDVILAERERCAQIAETLIKERRGLSLSFDMIAAAIRKQS